MLVQQLSIFLENRAGRLHAVTAALAAADINIHALTLADNSDFGILRLIVGDPARATAALRALNITCALTDVVAAEVADRPGGLAQVLALLAQAELNVEYMYAFAAQTQGEAVVVFRFEDAAGAAQVLQRAGVRLLSPAEVASR